MRVTSITITANPHVWSGHQAFRNVIVSLTGNRHHFTRTVFLGDMAANESRHLNLYTNEESAILTVIYRPVSGGLV